MGIKLTKLTGYIRTEVTIEEVNEDGGFDNLVHSPKHKRITDGVLTELEAIETRVNEEFKKNKKDIRGKISFLVNKRVYAEQLAFLVIDTDIEGDEGNIAPSADFYNSLSFNYLEKTFWSIVGSVMPTKKTSKTYSGSTSGEIG